MSDESFVLQNYNIIEKLASGGMAEIFLAKRKEAQFQNKFYVVKRVLPALVNNSEYIVFLKDEAKALSLMQHHNIIGFHDFFFENDQFYLVMEYISGKTLREVFSDFEKKNLSLSVEYLLYIIKEVAMGLEYAHRRYDYILEKSLNLVHRDLNPQNIMISFDGQIKIIDFGISKFDIRDDFTKTGMLKGKFGYMSPEQVDGSEIDARTDVFALGIVCWELLTNKRLFDGEDDFEKFNKIKNHQLVSICAHNSVLSKELDLIVMKALAPKVADRYQSAADFGYDISQYIAKYFPQFRPENFKSIIGKVYAAEFKKFVEKLKVHFHKTAVEEIESTKTSRLQSEAPIHQTPKKLSPFVPPPTLEKKKKAKRPKPTLLEPERYQVQVKGIQSSSMHTMMNDYGSKLKDIVFFASLGGIGWLLFLSYEQGYFHVLLHSISRFIK